jgi:hypothetical protein
MKRSIVVGISIVACASACSSKPPPAPVKVVEVPFVLSPVKAPAENAVKADTADHEKRLIAKMLKKVVVARGLQTKAAVPGQVLPRKELLDRVRAHVAREVPKEAIRQEGLILQLLGFVPPQFDYEKETFALLEAQLAGFYEPSDKTMYMAGDLDDDNASATLAHELVHALQDQYWDLAKRSAYKPSQGDQSSATSALAEGDATSAMIDIMIGDSGKTALDVPEEIFTEQMVASMASGAGANAPHVMRSSLVAPYIDGTIFVHALRRKGGWAAVNDAWTNAPTTTEQILHLDKYEAHEPALEVSTPTVLALPGVWKVLDSDSYGELGVKLTFAEWMEAAQAKNAAAHWGGDRGALIVNGDQYALAWHIRYDAGTKANPNMWAERAYPPLAAAVEARVGPGAVKDNSPLVCIERPALGPLGILRRGRDLVIVAGPVKVPAAGAWTSAADCATVKKWMIEIAANK